MATISYGWYVNNGDISFGRLSKIPHVEIEWYHALAPAILLALTRWGIPVSTTFLVLSAFADSIVFQKMLTKSALGYAIAAVVAYVIWIVMSRFLNEKNKVNPKHERVWRIAQWGTTGFLWYTWLSHDLANIAVFLPRSLPLEMLICMLVLLISILALIFWERGGKIQQIVIEKTSTEYVRSATCLLYTSPSPRDVEESRMPSSA